MNTTLNLVLERIEHLMHHSKYMKKRGEANLSEFLAKEAKFLATSMDNDDSLYVMKYYRYFSDSFGVTFEITHGDPELMFGGVV